MTSHPNAATAGATIGPSVLIVWLAGHLGLDIGAEEAVVTAGLIASLVLLIGREGVKGIIGSVWRGTGK